MTDPYCSHCIRIVVEGLTLDGVLATYKNRAVNLRAERRKIFRLYRGTIVLRKRLLHESRLLQSLGFELLREPRP